MTLHVIEACDDGDASQYQEESLEEQGVAIYQNQALVEAVVFVPQERNSERSDRRKPHDCQAGQNELPVGLEKQVHRDHKQLQKQAKGRKRRQVDPDAPPSGFAKPGPVSDELRKFLNLTKNDEIARTEVTKAINAYCKKHDLQNQADKRKIQPDAPLRKLLKLNKGDELTFFNLQTYLKFHFPNKEGIYPTA